MNRDLHRTLESITLGLSRGNEMADPEAPVEKPLLRDVEIAVTYTDRNGEKARGYICCDVYGTITSSFPATRDMPAERACIEDMRVTSRFRAELYDDLPEAIIESIESDVLALVKEDV